MSDKNFSIVKNDNHIPFLKDYKDFETLGFYPWTFNFKREALNKYKSLFDKNSINPFILNFIFNNQFVLSKDIVEPSLQTLLNYKSFDVEAYTLILINGIYSAEFSDEEDLPFSVYTDGLCNCLIDNPDFLQNRISLGDDLFHLLNSAYLHDGLILKVEDGEKLDKPIHIISINISKKLPIFFNPRIVIEIGEGAKLDLYQSSFSFDDDYFFENLVSEINLKKGALLNHYKFYKNSSNSLLFENSMLSCDENSIYNLYSFSSNSGIYHSNYNFSLWQNTSLNCNASFDCFKNASVVASADIKHYASSSFSNVNFYGAVSDEANVDFSTNLNASPFIFDVKTNQLSKILLLSNKAKGVIRPFQTISSQNVSAYHGAVVSGLDSELLFFLQSRGIDYLDALKIIKTSIISSAFTSLSDRQVLDEFVKLCWDN